MHFQISHFTVKATLSPKVSVISADSLLLMVLQMAAHKVAFFKNFINNISNVALANVMLIYFLLRGFI